jgi:acetyl-CoA acetyltransferase family protein
MNTHIPRVAIVGGARTAFLKAGGGFANLTSLDLSIKLLIGFGERTNLSAVAIDEIVWSTVLHDPGFSNLGREAILAGSLDSALRVHTISNNCISGLAAATMITDAIRSGRINTGIAGGVESMSCPPLLFQPRARAIFLKLFRTKTLKEKFLLLSQLRPDYFLPKAPSPKEPSTGKTMGEHCERMAKEFQITRIEQDEWASRSHQAAHQNLANFVQDIVPVNGIAQDGIIRAGTNEAKLRLLPSVFDKSATGTLTAGNSSALTDGASLVHLMSEEEAKKTGHTPLAFITDIEFASINPEHGLLMAPALALPKLLKRNSLTLSEIDYFEIHEAFAAQVLCTLKVWEQGWSAYSECKIGSIPPEKINVRGGSLALGHPFAATGGRVILTLARLLAEKPGSKGVISVCAAGGMGGCFLLSS